MENLKWTIQGVREGARFPVQEFSTKQQAVQAMEAVRQPKTAIHRDGRNYTFTVKN